MAAQAADEIELKLELTDDGAVALENSSLLPGEPRIVQQHAVYFDTPDNDLFRAGLSLRIRSEGGRRIQTVKADRAAAGMFVRPEWEREISDDSPVIDDTTPILAALGQKTATIAPLFVVENERRIWDLNGIECSLDQGRIVAGDRETRVREFELESTGARTEGIFALAQRINAETPVHLGVLSKAERGYRLLGSAQSASKASAVTLADDTTAAEAFQAIATNCLRQFRLNVPVILEFEDAAAVHQARVSLRRLRSALTIFKPMLNDGMASGLNTELRWLAAELGAAREIDVLISRMTGGPLVDRLAAARMERYANARAALNSRRARIAILDTVQWATAGEWLSCEGNQAIRQTSARNLAESVLERLLGKVERRGHNLSKLSDEKRHQMRKAAKKLRYAADFFSTLYDGRKEHKRHKRFVATLEDLQDRMGDLNDLATTPPLLATLGLIDEPEVARLMDQSGKDKLLRKAMKAHAALEDAKPFWR